MYFLKNDSHQNISYYYMTIKVTIMFIKFCH